MKFVTHKKYGKVLHHKCHSVTLHEECGKIVHRPCSSCISSIQEINKDFIEFSLLTQTWRVIKLFKLSCYKTSHCRVALQMQWKGTGTWRSE